MNQALTKLIQLCHDVGGQIDLVQGGGGNISVKDDDGTMYIKSSGCLLCEVSGDFGYTTLPYEKIAEYYDDPVATGVSYSLELEDRAADFMAGLAVGPTNAKPSMEAAMHVFLDRYVIHTHPVYLNAILCGEVGQDIVKQLKKAIDDNVHLEWVDFARPGLNLGIKIRFLRHQNSSDSRVSIFLLQNHGLLISSDNLTAALEYTKLMNSLAQELLKEMHLAKEDFSVVGEVVIDDPETFFSRALFPDFVIYGIDGYRSGEITVSDRGVVTFHGTLKKAQAAREVVFAEDYILRCIRGYTTPHWLTQYEIQLLLAMGMEKYRKMIL